MCEEYNGWGNRETWAAALYLNNDYGMYCTVQELISEAIASKDEEQDFACSTCLAENLEAMFEDVWGDGTELSHETYSMFKDIGSLYRVRWHEIATSFLDEAKVNA